MKKKKNKKEKTINFDKNSNLAIYLLILGSILFVIPLLSIELSLLSVRNTLYILVPALIFILSTIFGYVERSEYPIAFFTFIVTLPALIILPNVPQSIDWISNAIIISFMYFTLSFVAAYIGNYAAELDEESRIKSGKLRPRRAFKRANQEDED